VSKSAYHYPPDEFDQVDLNSRPKEVHAARRSLWGRMWPFLLVIVLVPAVAFLAVHFLASGETDGGDTASDGASTAAATDTPTAADTETPDDTSETPVDTATDQATEPVDDVTEPVDQPTDVVTEEPTEPVDQPTDVESADTGPVVDQSIAVLVRNNGLADAGSAADATQVLTDAGWTSASFDTVQPNVRPDTSTVYYNEPELEATAQQIAATIGVTGVVLDADTVGTAPGGILVIVTEGYVKH
jgi:hypothetical protein